MRKEIYSEIIHRIQNAGLDVQHFGLWNEDIDSLQQKPGFTLPAVFIEFEPVEWQQQQNKVKSGNMRVGLHILAEIPATSENDTMANLDLVENISAAIEGLNGENFNSFMLAESSTDYKCRSLYHNKEIFVTHLTNTKAAKAFTLATGIEPKILRG